MRRRTFERAMDALLPEPREPFRLPYDLDYEPPPPEPQPMSPPLGDEPKVKAADLTLRGVEEHVWKSGTSCMKGKLYTADGWEWVLFTLSERLPPDLAAQYVAAFEPELAPNQRKGVIHPVQVRAWQGRTVRCDLRWETWDHGAAWNVRRVHPLMKETTT
jgi:hypothetical protein